MHNVCLEANLEMFKLLATHGANVQHVNQKGYNCLMWVCQSHLTTCPNPQPLELAKLLMDTYNMIPHLKARDGNALIFASMSGYVDVVEELIRRGVDVNDTISTFFNMTALQIACQDGHLEVVKKLIEAGANVNVEDDRGDTPLLAAERNRHKAIVNYLKSKGATKKVIRYDKPRRKYVIKRRL